MENHSYEQIIGDMTNDPYINQLAQAYGSATNMHAEAHPSLPNYIAMTSGSTQGITDDSGPSSHPLNVPNIFAQLSGGQSRSLEESMPSSCYKSDSGNYAVRHDPEVYYTNLGTDCGNYVVPFSAIPDLSAKFTFITPNLCHDMHSNSCTGSSNVELQGDEFLLGLIPQLLASSQYLAGNTLIIITWDEDSGANGNHIPTILIYPTINHVSSNVSFTHYSMLKDVEDIFGVPEIGGATSATSMRAAFGLP
jgi:phosphatidylinositol-3-phosphatase